MNYNSNPKGAMMKRLSLKERISLAREELEEARPEEKVDDSVDVTEAIQQENDIAEIDEDIVQYKADENALEELQEVEEVLQEQANENDDKLNSSEEVNPEDVQASQEALRYAKRRCGFSLEEIKQDCSISYEGIKESPYTMLRISHEGIMDALKWVWEKIKAFFKKIVEFFKNIWKKILAFFGSFNAKLDLAIKKLEGAKWNTVGTLTEKQIVTANRLMTPALTLLSGGKITNLAKYLSFTDFSKRVTILNSVMVKVSACHKNVSDGFGLIVSGLSKEMQDNVAALIAAKHSKKTIDKYLDATLTNISKAVREFNTVQAKGIIEAFKTPANSKSDAAKRWAGVGEVCGVSIKDRTGWCATGSGDKLTCVDTEANITEINASSGLSEVIDYSNIGREDLLDTIKKLRSYSESLRSINIETDVNNVIKNIEAVEKKSSDKHYQNTESILEAYNSTIKANGLKGDYTLPAVTQLHQMITAMTSLTTRTVNKIVLDYSKNIKAALDVCVYLGSIATGENNDKE